MWWPTSGSYCSMLPHEPCTKNSLARGAAVGAAWLDGRWWCTAIVRPGRISTCVTGSLASTTACRGPRDIRAVGRAAPQSARTARQKQVIASLRYQVTSLDQVRGCLAPRAAFVVSIFALAMCVATWLARPGGGTSHEARGPSKNSSCSTGYGVARGTCVVRDIT